MAQPALRLKTRLIVPGQGPSIAAVDSPVPFGKGHLLLQFNGPPTQLTIEELRARGVNVLHGVPENGLLIAVDRPISMVGLGVTYAAPVEAADKISPVIAMGNGYFLAEFYPDVDLNLARGMVLRLGIEVVDNPDLGPRQLLIHVADSRRARLALAVLARQDETAYIFPASAELANGIPVRACAGPITTTGPVTQSIPTFGNGWDGPGLGAATISYVFSKMSDHLAGAPTQTEIMRAMAQWASVAKITWQPGSNPNANYTVNILFAHGAHGDGYPFDGPGGVLAHTFYPAPPNPEPIAGDMHLDDDEIWNIGSNTDLFSVTLHELGHALGLGHSDNPNDVMYPYYKMVGGLADGDKAAVLSLYAAAGVVVPAPVPTPPAPAPAPAPTPAPTPAPAPTPTPKGSDTTPPALTISSPGGTSVSTTSTTITVLGTATDNLGVASVTWATNTGSSGVASGTGNWSAAVPLLVGSNTVTIRAYDAAGNSSWRSLVVRRQ